MTALTDRLDRSESRLHSMEAELAELRRLAHEPEPEPVFVWSEPAEAVSDTAPVPDTAARERFDWSALVGARTLAWTGGAVTIVGGFFYQRLNVDSCA